MNAPPEATRGGRLILHVFPSFAVGGAQMRFVQLANHWGDRWRHMIVAMDGNLACRDRLDPALDVRYPALPLIKHDLIGNLRAIRAALLEWRPDVLVTSNWGSIEWDLARLTIGAAGPRHIHTEDGFGPEEADRQLARRVWTRRLALRRATVMLPSMTLLRIARDIWRLPEARLRHIPNGVDLDRFGDAKPPAPAPWPDRGYPVIGTVATLREEKNLPRLLDAFTQICAAVPARLAIVGDGPQRAALEDLVQRQGLAGRVVFTGHLDAAETAVRHFDVFALSSDTEQMPLSVLEAMAAGLPVVATDVGDVRTMLAAENAPFVTERNAAAMAAATIALLGNATLRHAIGAANRAKAARDYGQRGMFEAYASLYG